MGGLWEQWGCLPQLGGQTWRAAGGQRRKVRCHLSIRGRMVGMMRSGWRGEQRASVLLDREFLTHLTPYLIPQSSLLQSRIDKGDF